MNIQVKYVNELNEIANKKTTIHTVNGIDYFFVNQKNDEGIKGVTMHHFDSGIRCFWAPEQYIAIENAKKQPISSDFINKQATNVLKKMNVEFPLNKH